MMITKRALPRRTVLRGLGVTLALPFLDAMVPALRSAPAMPKRLGFFYVGNGTFVPNWMPTGEGRTFEYGPTMKALEPFRSKAVVVTGLYNRAGVSGAGDGGGVHTRAMAAWLSGKYAAPTEVNPILGKTADQHAADLWGPATALPSLELGLEDTGGSKLCDHGYTCVYKTLSWRGPTSPNPAELSPRVVFERLFGEGGTPEQRRARMQRRESILDGLMADARQLERQLGASDRALLDGELEEVRVIEQRIQKAEAQATEAPIPFELPLSAPASPKEHADLMYDLLAAAFQADITRVATFVAALESGNRVYRDIGVSEGYHSISHHAMNPEKQAKYGKIGAFHMSNWARFLGKLQDMPEGDGSVLDHTMLLYGGGISDGDGHNASNLPIVLAGGAALDGGRVIRLDPTKAVPLSNLMVSVLALNGVPVDRIGDSDGIVKELVEPLSL